MLILSGRFGREWFPLLLLGAVSWLLTNSPGTSQAQDSKEATKAQDKADAKEPFFAPPPSQVSDLSTRYRLIERYIHETDKVKAKPGELSQYRVASRDVIKITEEKTQGEPDVKEIKVQVIYSERPAGVSGSGIVTDVVRRYEALRSSNMAQQAPTDAQAPKLLEGLDLWIKPRPNISPLMILLTPNRRLSETEYSVNARQIFMPDLAAVLPTSPKRVGDRWQLSRPAIQAMLGEPPVRNTPLIAALSDVRKGAKAGEKVAVIQLAGRVTLGPGIENAVKAQILFTFVTPTTTPPAGTGAGVGASASTAKADEGVVDVFGSITELRMTKASTIPVPGGNSRLRRMFNEELVLQRQTMLASSSAPLIVPSPAPIPTEANSWLTYDDPQGRFHFRHPQDLLAQNTVRDPNVVDLADNQLGTSNGSILTLIFQPKTNDETTNQNNQDPEFHAKELNKGWQESRQDVLRGPAGWLPDADWKEGDDQKRVYRIEAALKPSGAAGKNVQRIFLDHYLVLFTNKESLAVDAMTGRDPPLPFRKLVESILKTFKIGPSVVNEKVE